MPALRSCELRRPRWSDRKRPSWPRFVNNVKGSFSGAPEAAETGRGYDVSNVRFPRLRSQAESDFLRS
jgi:hypothetical protein